MQRGLMVWLAISQYRHNAVNDLIKRALALNEVSPYQDKTRSTPPDDATDV